MNKRQLLIKLLREKEVTREIFIKSAYLYHILGLPHKNVFQLVNKSHPWLQNFFNRKGLRRKDLTKKLLDQNLDSLGSDYEDFKKEVLDGIKK